jgi:hypothetical protein
VATGRAPTGRAAAVLLAVALTAAACSSSPPVGKLGATLPAMNGTVTVDKVISPATPRQAAAGAKLVAVVLTVHSPAGTSGKFTAIYSVSKLVTSTKLVARAHSTVQFPVTECAAYAPFGPLAPGASQTGCEIFELPLAAVPTELKINGKAKADWLIAASDIQPGTGIAAPAPASATPTTPTTTTGGTGNTGNSGAATTTTTGGTGNTGATPTTTKAAATAAASKKQHHHPVFTILPRIRHVSPRRGFAGTQVTITGRKLANPVLVTFNGLPASVVTSSAEKLVVTVPTGATTGPIVVTTSTGSASSPKTFELP